MSFATKTWYDAPNPLTPLNAEALNDLESRIDDLQGRVLSLEADFGAVGDGTADDTAAINAAIIAADSQNKLLIGSPGSTYRISSSIEIAVDDIQIDWANSTVLKSGTTSFTGINVTGVNVHMYNLSMDGNKTVTPGAGLVWAGGEGKLYNSKVNSNRLTGITVTGAGAELDLYTCEASSNGISTFSAHGFAAASGGLMRTYECVAEFNDWVGFFLYSTAADECHIDGYAHRNLLGFDLRSDNGTIDEAIAVDNDRFGLEFYDEEAAIDITGWNCNFILAKNNGATSGDPSATGVELYSTSYSHFGTIISIGNSGYGLALGRNCYDNTFGSVLCDGVGSIESDPGLLIAASDRNSFGSVSVRNHTFGISMGEDVVGANNDNEFSNVYAYQCSYAVLRLQQTGARNHFGNVVARNCTTLDPGNWPGLISIMGPTETTVESFAHKTTTTAPTYLVHITSANNIVRQVHGAPGSSAAVNDTAGTSKVERQEIQTYTDSGQADFFSPGLWAVEVFSVTSSEPLASAIVSMTRWTDGSGKRKISVLASHSGWSAGTITMAAVNQDLTTGVFRTSSSVGSGQSIQVRYVPMVLP
jgi:hypothetical protein